VKLGMPARISVDAFPNQKFKGHVRRIAPYVLDIEKQARTVDVEVEFGDPKQTSVLLVGYSADVEIILATREDALRVPTAAIQDGNRVLVYNADRGVLEARTIVTGLANWQFTEVTSGLSAGERVVMSLERAGVKAGAKARPEKSTASKS
jgi:HlyD family secretion protein